MIQPFTFEEHILPWFRRALLVRTNSLLLDVLQAHSLLSRLDTHTNYSLLALPVGDTKGAKGLSVALFSWKLQLAPIGDFMQLVRTELQ